MRIAVIGNGAAGNEAAETIRKYDKDAEIIMFSQEDYPEYSPCALPDYIAGWIPRTRLFLKEHKDYEDKQIRTEFGSRVNEINIEKREVVVAGKAVSYDKLIIATGSKVFVPPVKGADLPGNFVLKSVRDVDGIVDHGPKKVAVIGAGNIGVEIAAALKLQGCQVALVEVAERVMPKIFDHKPSLLIRKMLESRGIEICTGETVREVKGASRVEGIASDKRAIACDTVIWATGFRPNVELAQKSGIGIGESGGIRVNTRLETDQPGVYACGDCTESLDILTGKPVFTPLWANAKRQAQVAALNCIGRAVEYEGSFSTVIEEIYGTVCISLGLTGETLGQSNVRVLEKEDKQLYYKLLIVDDRIAGLQAIGRCNGIGAVAALIKNKTPLCEVQRVFQNRALILKNPWYLGAVKYILECMNEMLRR